MKIKKLSSDLIAVFLSERDMAEYNIDISDKFPQTDELHRFLFEIMEVIKAETGFDPYHGGQVVVEASPVPTGLNLLISKVKPVKKKTITREQFNKVRKVTVVHPDRKNNNLKSSEYVKQIIEELGLGDIIKQKKNEEVKNRVFIFNSFADWEQALCRLEADMVKDFSLYRMDERYALITGLKKESVQYNILSEFSFLECVKDVTVLNIKETWGLIVQGEELAQMCVALKAMQ